MSLWLALDLIVIAVYVIVVLYFKSRGFLKSSETLVSVILTFCLVPAVMPAFQGMVKESPVGQGLYARIEEAVMDSALGEEINIALPDFLQDSLEEELQSVNEAKDNAVTATANFISDTIIKVVGGLLLFLIIKLLIFIAFRILNVMCHIKLFAFVNGALGMLLGFINATIVIYVLCALAVIFVPVEYSIAFKDALSETFLAGFFYNNNILINIFM